ncbi:MAG: hypothetical protein HY332_05595 [Chloroflexi bacterium]|nr:hypothetical protein [Chloroflexota bacterium]
MSDLLVHWAVFDDCRRLAQVDGQIEPLFREWIQTEREAGRLGAVTRGGSRTLGVVLPWARDGWPNDRDDVPRKVAFVLGALAHASADRLMKPLMSLCAGADWNEIHHRMQGRLAGDADRAGDEAAAMQEISAYYEAHVFRQVYLGGDEEPFNRFLLAADTTATGRALEEFVRALFQRALLACHTLDPDSDDVQGWLDRLFTTVQPLYLDVDLWVRVFQNPDPAKVERFMVETAFYRADDPAIQVARALQAGRQVDDAYVQAALQPEANQSRYGQSLQTGIRYLRAASAFWRREIDLPQLRERLDARRSPDETHPLRIPAA